MKRKILNISIALVLALSLGLIVAAPAAANGDPVYAEGHDFRMEGNGTAEWSTTQISAGDYSVKLYAGSTPGIETYSYGRVNLYLLTPVALSALSANPTFYANGVIEGSADNLNSGENLNGEEYWNHGPYLNILLDFDSDGVYDTGLEGVIASSDGYEEGWHLMEGVDYYMSGDDTYKDEANTQPFSYWSELETVKDYTVVGVQIMLGMSSHTDVDQVVYIDDVTIGEDTCAMEPRVINTTQTEGYNTIQDAIDYASTSDTISVAEGLYSENVVVDVADLVIQSAGDTADTTINAADASDYVVEITAGNVTLDGFTITGINTGVENMAAVILQGVDYCTITNNILTDNHKCAINLYSTGGAYSDYNTVSNNVINGPASLESRGIKVKGSYNTISGNQVYNIDNPILIWGYDDSETASPDYNTVSNNIIGPGDDTAAHKYGVKIKTGHYNTVTGNTITDATEAAIYIYTDRLNAPETNFDPRPSGDNISDNIISGGKVGVALLDGANTNTVAGNSITGTSLAGVLGSLSQWPGDWTGSYETLAYTGEEDYHVYLQIDENIIENNTITDCGHGVAMEYADDNALTGNSIEDNTGDAAIAWEGISFTANGRAVYFGAESSGNDVNYNNISGNTGGVENANTEETLNAEYNYWGAANGPYHATGVHGDGDAVSDYVDYIPWLDAYPDGEALYPVNNITRAEGYATIGSAIGDADPGDTITCVAGTYTEGVYIDKSLTLQSEEGAEETEIHGSSADAVVTIELGWGSATPVAETVVLDGFGIYEGIYEGVNLIDILKVNNSSNLTISNCILGDGLYGIYSNYGDALAGGSSVTIEGNEIYCAMAGVYFNYIEEDSTLTITDNDIHNNMYGIDITDANADSSVQVHYNSIYSNTTYGVKNVATATVNATCNWWGDVAGPDINTNPYYEYTDGDEIYGDVDYIPWLIQSELAEGWNIFSAPIAPDPASGQQAFADLVEAGLQAAYYFDSDTQLWAYDMENAGPLDAAYIKMADAARMRYCISSDATFPSQKDMKVGWNLIGLADIQARWISPALMDAYWATGQADLWGYSKVISPSLNGDSWSHIRDGRPPHQLFPTRGYWVFMVNDGTLGGFSTTPIVEVELP